MRDIAEVSGVNWKSQYISPKMEAVQLEQLLHKYEHENTRLLILKTHNFNQVKAGFNWAKSNLNGSYLFTPLRDIKPTICSRLRAERGMSPDQIQNYPEIEMTRELKQLLNRLETLRTDIIDITPRYVFKESDINDSSRRIISKISYSMVNNGISQDMVLRISSKNSSEQMLKRIDKMNNQFGFTGNFTEYDRETHLHSNHISRNKYIYQWSADHDLISRNSQRVINEIISTSNCT